METFMLENGKEMKRKATENTDSKMEIFTKVNSKRV